MQIFDAALEIRFTLQKMPFYLPKIAENFKKVKI